MRDQHDLPQGARANLDLLRGGAALLVFVGHVRQIFFVTTPTGRISRIAYFITGLGHQAVLLFFVLSGFLVVDSVIARPDLRRYAAARASRLLTVYWPALALGGLLDLVGSRWFGSGTLYGGGHPLFSDFAVVEHLTPTIAVQNVLFLQSIRAHCLGSNLPLWSLSFEAWFYVAFALLWFPRTGETRGTLLAVAALVAISVLVGPNVIGGFAIWLLGAALAAARRGLRGGTLLLVCLAVACGGYAWLMVHPDARSIVRSDCIVGGVMTVVVALAVAFRAAPPRWFARIATALSSVSYSLYLVHMPMLAFIAGALGTPPLLTPALSAFGRAVGVALITFAYAVLVWFVFERRTPRVRAWLTEAT